MLNENITRLNTGLHTSSGAFQASLYLRGAGESGMKFTVPRFHVSRGKERETRLIVHEATKLVKEAGTEMKKHI